MGIQAGGNKPGANSNLSGGSTGTFQPGQNFWEFNPRNIANINPLQAQAARGMQQLPGLGSSNIAQANSLLRSLAGGGSGYFDQAISAAKGSNSTPEGFKSANNLLNDLYGVSRRQVTGENVANDPAVKAAQDRFRTARLPMLQSMAAQQGLGRSNTVQNASALAQSNELLPLIQESIAREERGIGREMSALGQGIGTQMQQGASDRSAELARRDALVRSLMGAGGQEAANLGNAAQGLAGIQAQQYGQGLQTTAQGFDMGSQLRDVNQQRLDAPYDEQMRLYSEALNSIYGPLGMIGSLVGGTATSTSRKK